jgi:hypothetical protein
VALGWTQPLTEISTRDVFLGGGYGRSSGNLESSGPVQRLLYVFHTMNLLLGLKFTCLCIFQFAFLCCPPNIVYSLIAYNPVSVTALLLYRLSPMYLRSFRVVYIKLY